MSDAAVKTWLAHVLEVREERLSTVTGTGKRQSYFWYDNTSPLIRGGEVVTNGCPLERERGLALGLCYEWGPEQQDAFEQTMGPHLDLVRWDGVVAELGTHWVNSAPRWGEGAIRELEALAPGMQPVLHDLGKTSLFRGLRQYPLGMYDAVLAPGERSPLEVPIRIGDSRVRDQAPERSEYRSARIAARGMAEWFSRALVVLSNVGIRVIKERTREWQCVLLKHQPYLFSGCFVAGLRVVPSRVGDLASDHVDVANHVSDDDRGGLGLVLLDDLSQRPNMRVQEMSVLVKPAFSIESFSDYGIAGDLEGLLEELD